MSRPVVRSHRDLIGWQKAMDLAVLVHDLTKLLPDDERFRIVDQLMRSVGSVAANLAEGHARDSRKDYARFVAIAKGSLMETETFVMLSVRLGFVTVAQADPALRLIEELSKILTALRASLVRTAPSPQR